MRCDMIAMSVRNKGERLRIPRVEPEVFVRQIDTAFVFNLEHEENLTAPGKCATPSEIDTLVLFPFHAAVQRLLLVLVLSGLTACRTLPPPRVVQVPSPKPLPLALDKDFAIRKTKLFLIDPAIKPVTGVQDPSILYERSYRLFGAITAFDQHQRFGNYFDFFWRARRRADVTVRLEYRQAQLHALVQVREAHYPQARGSYKTEFTVIGDDFFDHGRVTAWRASLVVGGRMVATTQSYLWQ